MADDPIRVWTELEKSGQGDGVLEIVSRSANVETGYGPVRFALGPRGERRILIPCPEGTNSRHLIGGPKLASNVTSYSHGQTRQLFIDLLCYDRRLDVVFGELCGEILRRILDGEAPIEAVSGTISEFRELLLSEASGAVGRSEVIGLLGELLILKRLSVIRADAVASWMGPFEQRHDFRRGLNALEVKTSGRSDTKCVTINGSEQLLAPMNGALALIHVKIEPADTGNVCVSKLFNELAPITSDPVRLRTGLGKLGCTDPEDEEWNRHAFELQGIDAYKVEDGFPRVTPLNFQDGRLPEAISELTYKVDLTVAGRHRMNDSYLSVYLSEMMK